MAQSLHKELYPITILKMVSYSQAHCHKYIAALGHAPICVLESGARSQVKVIIIYNFLLGARYIEHVWDRVGLLHYNYMQWVICTLTTCSNHQYINFMHV